MKQVFLILLLTGCSFFLSAQATQDSINIVDKDSVVVIQTDSNSILQLSVPKDSMPAVKKDTVASAAENYYRELQEALRNSFFLNASGAAVATVNQERMRSNSDLIFYFLLVLVILLSFLRFFFSRYFFNLFRVFFNTSLRQGQLTDQLLQAKQASMFFNLLFFFYRWYLYLFPAVTF